MIEVDGMVSIFSYVAVAHIVRLLYSFRNKNRKVSFFISLPKKLKRKKKWKFTFVSDTQQYVAHIRQNIFEHIIADSNNSTVMYKL